ncbi:hypothetical protein [Hymenobacter profundi]|uniref:Uncharacterized protein n=1 Tax=Hymenobacter profundi TaxID=1982110 RepID=A0ABS6X5T2_9BACT|nr:hypothetical protein [Hymenobacter profundi]MBW3131212.1 hypothetical protein [Hymenobacter profundi]
MKNALLCICFAWAVSSLPAVAQQAKTKVKTKQPTANGYHRTSNTKAKARSGAYSRYDRSNRRDEENLKLAPGLRLNMPSPPTTDYMGRPLKKKPANVAAAGATSLSTEKTTPPPTSTRKRK